MCPLIDLTKLGAGTWPDWLGVIVNGVIAGVAVSVPIREAKLKRDAQRALADELDRSVRQALIATARLAHQALDGMNTPTFRLPSAPDLRPAVERQIATVDGIAQRGGLSTTSQDLLRSARDLLTETLAWDPMEALHPHAPDVKHRIKVGIALLIASLEKAGPDYAQMASDFTSAGTA